MSNRSNRHVVPARIAGMVLLLTIFYAAAATAGDKDAIIINDASMPVPTRDVEQSSREPYFENPPTASVYVSQQTRLYAAPGTEVGAAIYPSSTLASANCNVVLSGYLTDF